MSGAPAPFRLVCEFELTAEETRKIASRRAFRAAMGGLGPGTRMAPVAIFLGLLALAAGLALSGVVAKRHAEIAILLLIPGYALARSAANLRVRRAYRAERRRAEALGRAGMVRVEADERQIAMSAAATLAGLRYADGVDADEADDVLYVWGANGETVAVPTRVLPPGEAQRFL